MIISVSPYNNYKVGINKFFLKYQEAAVQRAKAMHLR